MTEPFSVLLPVWAGDDAAWFAASLRSVAHDQTLRPDQIVIVLDGPVGDELRDVLDRAASDPGTARLLEILELPTNQGLPTALNAGLAACRHEIVARQDADDISTPERFAAQLPLLAAGADLVGSALREFTGPTGPPPDQDRHVPAAAASGLRLGPVRPRPTEDAAIRRYLRSHSPFNHPSVVFRRSQVLAVGGYPDLRLQEDYLLWARLLAAGARGANCADVLVLYRTGDALYERRGGTRNLRSDVVVQRELRRLGFISPARVVVNLTLRLGYRTVPAAVRRRLYQRVLTRRPGTGGAATTHRPDGSLP